MHPFSHLPYGVLRIHFESSSGCRWWVSQHARSAPCIGSCGVGYPFSCPTSPAIGANRRPMSGQPTTAQANSLWVDHVLQILSRGLDVLSDAVLDVGGVEEREREYEQRTLLVIW